jgi:hypothetical protein
VTPEIKAETYTTQEVDEIVSGCARQVALATARWHEEQADLVRIDAQYPRNRRLQGWFDAHRESAAHFRAEAIR